MPPRLPPYRTSSQLAADVLCGEKKARCAGFSWDSKRPLQL